ncbi:hypothetical protein BDW71DRAFT_69282 [Aspergillus fruticulosus]
MSIYTWPVFRRLVPDLHVMDGLWKRTHIINHHTPGQHVFRIRLRTQHCVLEKIVAELKGIRDSYLGRPRVRYRKALPSICFDV